MSIDSDFTNLINEGQSDPTITRDRQVAALLVHARHTSQVLEDFGSGIAEIRETLLEMTATAKMLQSDMAANTAITSAVRDAITAGRVATLIIKWIGGIALAFGGMYGLWAAIKHGGTPPDIGIGP